MSDKNGEEQPVLRRSSRSTRGSIKPIVDLSKLDSSPIEEDPKSKKKTSKTKKEENDDVDVQILQLSEEEEEYKEPTTRSRRQSKSKDQIKGSSKLNQSEQSKPAENTKIAKRATKKDASGSSKAPNKSVSKISSKKSSSEQLPEEPTASQNDTDLLYELSEKEMKEINTAFDINSNGSEEILTSDKLKTAIRSLGFEPRAHEIQKLIEKFSNKNGEINRHSFHKIMAFKIGSAPGRSNDEANDEISKVFNLLDLDKKGMITMENLRSVSKELNEEITDEELHEMIVEADMDGDLMINKQEFHNIMKKTSLY